jgi:UDP-glucose:(heptosyl)LPS alpha-1,3-glucosyltransferase
MSAATIPCMHIALVVDRLERLGGGAERSTHEVARQLIERGHKVTIIAGRCAEDADVPGTQTIYWTRGRISSGWKTRGFARWARRQLRVGPYDVSLSFTTAVPATVIEPWGGTVRETLERNVALRPGGAARCWKRITLAANGRQRALLTCERRSFRDPKVRKVVALSNYVARQLRQHYDLSDDHIAIIPNGAQLPDSSPADRAYLRQRVRGGFNIDAEAVVFAFAAMNPRLKWVTPLLYATKLLADRGLRPVVMLAGRIGYAEQHLAATLGIRDLVRIVGTTERMLDLYCAADVTVLPTYYDPSSRVVIESLLAGTPAISTAYNGASDFLRREDGRWCGRVIDDPGDVPALAQAMAELMDPQERCRCRQAIAGLEPRLSIRRHVDQLEALLTEVRR